MVIARDDLPNGYIVSTIWRSSTGIWMDSMIGDIFNLLGVSPEEIGRADLNTPGDWETMVFYRKVDLEVDFRRYSSEEDALKGHAELVEKWGTKVD